MTLDPLCRGLLVAACAFFLTFAACNKAIQRGDDLAAQGQWFGAYESYQVALDQDPDDEDLRLVTEQARARALAQAIGQGEQALDRAAWVEANRGLERVMFLTESTSEPNADAFIDRFIAIQADTLEALMGSADPESLDQAFALLRLSTPHLLSQNDRSRAEVIEVALATLQPKEDQGQFGQAMALSARWSGAADSGAQASLHQADQARQERWRQALRRRAGEVAGEGDGARAWVIWRAVGALGGETEGDRAAFEALDARLKEAARLPIALDALPATVPRALILGVEGVSEARSAQDALLMVGVEVLEESCAQTKQERTAIERYVSGTRFVPSPRRAQLAQELGQLQSQESQLHMHVQQRQEDVWALERQTDRFEQDTDPWARQQVQIAQARLGRADQALDHLTYQYNQIANRRVTGQQAQRAKQDDLNRARFLQNQASDEVQDARRQLRQMEEQLRRIHRQWQQNAQEQGLALDQLRQAQAALALAQGERRRARTLYQSEPAEVEEEVWSDYPYVIETWTRRCERTYTLRYDKGGQQTPLSRTTWVETQDEAHPAHPTITLVQNTLNYPLTQASQSQRVLQEMQQDLAAQHRTVMVGWLRTHVDQAQATKEGQAKRLGLVLFYPEEFAQAYRAFLQEMAAQEPLLEGVKLN